MARRKTYGGTEIKSLDVSRLLLSVTGAVVVAIDVAKALFAAAIMLTSKELLRIVRFTHPEETEQFFALLESLRARAGEVTVVMEPTGTYGDALRYQLHRRKFPVMMVQPKRTHDAMEVFDGVRSAHDNKDAVTLSRLHLEGASAVWRVSDATRRSLRALFDDYLVHDAKSEMLFGHIEARVVRHWPELQRWLSVRDHASGRALLAEFGSPQSVAARPDQARALLLRASRGALSPSLIEGAIASATSTMGVPMVDNEIELLKGLAASLIAELAACKQLEERIDASLEVDSQYVAMRPIVGPMAAAALRAYLGPVSAYSCARAYLKAAGLNLREESSGNDDGPLHISKRGPSLVRKLLYMATLRAIDRDAVARAWYMGRRSWTRDQRTAAVVALMRKLLKGLFHACKHGVPFDSNKLFDTRRLTVVARETPAKSRRAARRTEPRSITAGGSRHVRNSSKEVRAHSA